MSKSSIPWICAAGAFFQDRFGVSPDLEDMITKIEARIASLKDCSEDGGRIERGRLANNRGSLADALRDCFASIRGTHPGSYASFAKNLVKPGDTLVTFNYDDALDRELRSCGIWNASNGYGFHLGDKESASEVKLLKLHGSVNWLISLCGGAVGGTFLVNPVNSMGEAPVIHRGNLRFLGYEEFSGRTYESGAAPACLMLPGRTKQFFYDTSMRREFSGFWESLWGQAKTALRSSESIVICGYSMPEADVRARELLLENASRSTPIEIVSGNDTERIAQEFRSAGFSLATESQDRYFSDWVRSRTG